MTDINLAPYSVRRFFDGTEVTWILKKDGDSFHYVHDIYETREDAESERNRLNTRHALDSIIF